MTQHHAAILLTGAILAAALGTGAGAAMRPPSHRSAAAALGPRIDGAQAAILKSAPRAHG